MLQTTTVIPLAVLALVAVAAAASNSSWVPYRDQFIRWAIGEDAIIANAEVNRKGALLTLRHGQPGMIYGSAAHDPNALVQMVNVNFRESRVSVSDCRAVISFERALQGSS